MLPRSVITLFCDDVRNEKEGLVSLIGIYSNNINVPDIPFVFPKLVMYTRIHIDVADEIENIIIRVSPPDGDDHDLTHMDRDFISESQENSRDKNVPIVGLMSQAVSAPFIVRQEGLFKIKVVIDDDEYLGGVVNFKKNSGL